MDEFSLFVSLTFSTISADFFCAAAAVSLAAFAAFSAFFCSANFAFVCSNSFPGSINSIIDL